jgi:dephospho-CoA kinase
MSALRVGLTGGIASGKSTVAQRLTEAGFTVVDADRLVAELYRPGEPGTRTVAALFGPELLAADGSVDKAAVGRLVFADSTALAQLEAAIHPLVRQRFSELAEQAGGVSVLEATKLIEAGFAPDFDLIVTVEAPEELRIARAIVRGLPEAEVRARIASQAGETERRRAATVVIENDSTLAALLARTDRLIDRFRTLTSSKRPEDEIG